jgi:FG-GAP repeat protein
MHLMNQQIVITCLTLVLLAAGTWAQLPSIIDLNTAPGTESTEVTRIYGDDVGDALGGNQSNAIAFGDVNGDGFDDVILGAVLADPPGGGDAGEVVVVYGSTSLTASAEVDLNTAPGTHGETRILGDDGGDQAGHSVASGDVNGDSFDDLILGVPSSISGEVVVVYGSASLPASAEIDLNTPSGTHGETRILGEDGSDEAGHSVASGDINGDGFDDVIIGIISADTPGGLNAGEAVLIFGSNSLTASAEIDLSVTPGVHGETRILGDDVGDWAGFSVTSGDVNGDGFDDVILGAVLADPPGGSLAGEVVVVYGSATLPASSELDLNTTPGTHGETRILGDDGGAPGDLAGFSVISGDINGDGFDDVIIGAYLADPGSPERSDAGEVVVVYGSTSLTASAEVDLNTTPGTHGETRILGDDLGGEAGWSVASGDVNGDGFYDVIIGAHSANPSGGSEAGEVVVVYGSTSLPVSAEINLNIVNGDVRVLGDNAFDYLGECSEAEGDVNRDGFADFASSAFGGDNPSIGGSNYSGVGYLIYGDGTASNATVSQFSRTGDGAGGDAVPPTNFGPVARCVIDFSDNDTADNGSGGASLTTVTLTRSLAGITDLSPIAGVGASVWEITTNRTGWASADVTFQYTDAEIAGIGGLIESNLVIFQAPALIGPWAELPTTVDTLRNEVTVTVTGFSYFAVADGNTVIPVELSVFSLQ